MRILQNTGSERVVDVLRKATRPGTALDLATPKFSLAAFAEVRELLHSVSRKRLVLPSTDPGELELLGSDADRAFRNCLQARWLARQCAEWFGSDTEVRLAPSGLPQAMVIVSPPDGEPPRVIQGSCPFTTDGLGLAPGAPYSLVQCADGPGEAAAYTAWFSDLWRRAADGSTAALREFLGVLQALAAHQAPSSIYGLVLHGLFKDRGEDLDEDQIVKSATGIRETMVWQKLYKFQRDAAIGAIDKLNRYGGCIIADSVGLGKTFEALAVIKYHELRNDRVLVLCPKRLRENWTLYAANDRRNVLADDRFNYDVLNHTDLSRDRGMSADIDLANLNWGNYDLVVIDESHNFRNKNAPKQGGETRYDRLMRRIVQEGVKTRVLMLSATPVNNRLADLRNQIAFATENNDAALAEHGIANISATTQRAQKQFNDWLELPEESRTPELLVEMLGFDYFSLLDLLTIARSRKHIEKYYGLAETGEFPERLKPLNHKPDIDLAGELQPIADINREIRHLKLAVYAPLQYVLGHRQEAYNRKYSTTLGGGRGTFKQSDREASLIHLLRVNVLKRLESSVHSFALTVERQLNDVNATLARIERVTGEAEFEELDIDDVDVDDPTYESLLVGRKVKVLLSDVDLVRWQQDLVEDRDRLEELHAAAKAVTAQRDAKLAVLREVIAGKCAHPINPGNRKIILFTAFADTAQYLYEHLATWARDELGLHSALVTGAGPNRTNLPGLRHDMASILTAFAPRAKERPADLADEGELDLLIATDCISEGQNLQDCDWLVNYDIHWNPVRIIQRFGRIDRLGSPNDRIQLVNFWPNMELEEYINLEQRVSGRMTLMDVSATGEENLIHQQSGDPMNDLEYRRKQLLKLQDAVIDLEDLSTGISIADLTLTDFRIDLAEHLKAHPGSLEKLPLGAFAVTTSDEADLPPGVVFCLRAESERIQRTIEPGYPLTPHFLVHIGDDGAVLLPYTRTKQILDRLRRLCAGQDQPDQQACARFDRETRQGEDMTAVRQQLAAAVASVAGKSQERSVASLFTPGGTHALAGEFAGVDDFEVVAFLVVLGESS